MRALSAAELINIWEWGQSRSLPQRALILLAAACPDTPTDELAKLSIGQRDALLLTLREWTFGPQLIGLAACPGCGEQLELTFDAADIRVASEIEPADALSLSVAGYAVRFRLPNSLDLAALTGQEDILASRHQLLERCLVTIQQGDEARTFDQLPVQVLDAVVERMAQADPQAEIQLALSCPACSHQWPAIFDIVSFFWSEINAWAYRVLREVHILASAYGWREADILALSPWRRQCYLELVSG